MDRARIPAPGTGRACWHAGGDVSLPARAASLARDRPRRGGRVVECAGFEIRYTGLPYRGFESLPLRHDRLPVVPGRGRTMRFGACCKGGNRTLEITVGWVRPMRAAYRNVAQRRPRRGAARRAESSLPLRHGLSCLHRGHGKSISRHFARPKLPTRPWWPCWSPRDDTSQTPPGPEGSNGSGGFGRRGVAGRVATIFGPCLPGCVVPLLTWAA